MAGHMKIVIDTCALIWWTLDLKNFLVQRKKLVSKWKRKNGLVPSIAIWEIAIKIKNKKLDLGVDINDYIAALKKIDAIQIIPIDEEIWLESVKLKWEHRDPADRVVVAIAQKYQSAIITADKKIASFYGSVIW